MNINLNIAIFYLSLSIAMYSVGLSLLFFGTYTLHNLFMWKCLIEFTEAIRKLIKLSNDWTLHSTFLKSHVLNSHQTKDSRYFFVSIRLEKNFWRILHK